MTVKTYLSQISSKAIIRDSEKESIKRSISTLSSRLDSYFGTEIESHFIFGSYKRSTALPRIMDDNSDVDYMVVFVDKRYNPQTYLDKLRRFAQRKYSRSEIKQSNPTIILSLNHIHFELVPAIKSAFWNKSYQIPDKASSYNDWISTDPLALWTNLVRVNNANSSLIKPLIRLYKYWNAARGYPLSSYDLEKAIIEYANSYGLFSWSKIKLEDFFFDYSDHLSVGIFASDWIKKEERRLKQLVKEAYRYWKRGNEASAVRALKKILPPL